MPARIRLQIKGHPANRFFWIVASSSKTNARGRPIERMGFWFPDRKGVYSDRSIVLNRPRLKYWIGQGAEVTKGAYHILSLSGFLPKKPPPFGSGTLYETPFAVLTPEAPKPPERDFGAAEEIKEDVLETERVTQLRKQEYLENAKSLFHKQSSEVPENEVKEYMEKYYTYLDKLKESIPNDVKSKTEAYLSMVNMMNDGEYTEFLDPGEIEKTLNISREEAEKIHKVYQGSGLLFSKADAEDFKLDLSRKKRVKKFMPGDKVYMPNEKNITPYPKFEDVENYQRDFHGIVNPLKPNKEYGFWFEEEKEQERNYKKVGKDPFGWFRRNKNKD